MSALYIPPKPLSLWSVIALFRVLWRGDGNLLELLPAAAYKFDVGNLGYSRRSTVLFNEPELVRHIMKDPQGIFPKSDLMVNALELPAVHAAARARHLQDAAPERLPPRTPNPFRAT